MSNLHPTITKPNMERSVNPKDSQRLAYRRAIRKSYRERVQSAPKITMHPRNDPKSDRICCLQSSGLCRSMSSKHHRRNKKCWLSPETCEHCEAVKSVQDAQSPFAAEEAENRHNGDPCIEVLNASRFSENQRLARTKSDILQSVEKPQSPDCIAASLRIKHENPNDKVVTLNPEHEPLQRQSRSGAPSPEPLIGSRIPSPELCRMRERKSRVPAGIVAASPRPWGERPSSAGSKRDSTLDLTFMLWTL